MRALIISAALLVSACALAPDASRAGYSHTSHPFAGPPFGPQSEEDWLDQMETSLVWRNHLGVNYELGLGYRLTNGGFYGPKLIFNGRVYKEFDFRK